MREWLYSVAAHPTDVALAEAEAEALLGAARVGERTWVSRERVDAARTAYFTYGAELLHRGSAFAELLDYLDRHPVAAEGFAIDARKWPRRGGPAGQTLCGEIAARVCGIPDLDAPRTEFALVLDTDQWFLGRIVSRNRTDWEARTHKPEHFSGAIGPQPARAAVNMVARAGDTIVDPCCGSGTIVLEAESIGVRAAGFDLAPIMPRRARVNARYLGIAALFGRGDVRSLAGRFDAVVTNLPYDKMLQADEGFYRDALANIARLAPRVAFYAGRDLSEVASAAGIEIERTAAQATRSIIRVLHIGRSRRV
jgi:predicted RNA methylase